MSCGAPVGIRTRVFGSKDLQQVTATHQYCLDWASLRKGFLEYLQSRSYSDKYVVDLLHYLDAHVTVIDGPADIIGIFSRVKKGRRHVWLGLRVLFNYLEALGYNAELLNVLRKALPKVSCGVDLKVPEEPVIIKSLRLLSRAPRRYQVLYSLLVDSGLRLIEAIEVIAEFRVDNVEQINGFYRIAVGAFRSTKQAYYAYFTEATFKLLTEASLGPLCYTPASRYYKKMGYVCAKYV